MVYKLRTYYLTRLSLTVRQYNIMDAQAISYFCNLDPSQLPYDPTVRSLPRGLVQPIPLWPEKGQLRQTISVYYLDACTDVLSAIIWHPPGLSLISELARRMLIEL